MNEKTEREEQRHLREALHTLGEGAAPREDCPDSGRLWAAVHHQADRREVGEILDHLGTCPLCREAWELAEELRQGEKSTMAATSRGPWLRLAGVASILLLVVTAGLFLRAGRAPAPPVERGSAESGIVVEEAGPMPREAFTLRWQGPPEATAYDLRISWIVEDKHRVLVAETELSKGIFTVPPEALARVPADTTLLVYIEALSEGAMIDARGFRIVVE